MPKTTTSIPKHSRPSLRHAMLKVLIAIAIICIPVGALGAWYYQTKTPVLPTKIGAVTSSAANEGVEEQIPSDHEMQVHSVAPNDPRYLRIPSIGVNARIQGMGINDEGNISAPRNAQDVGWYQKSARPGESGTSFIDGHLNGVSSPGVFAQLHTLEIGDAIFIERGDGKMIVYRVTNAETKELKDINMSSILKPRTSEQTLVLMTCIGIYDKNAKTYDRRHIVYAELTQSD